MCYKFSLRIINAITELSQLLLSFDKEVECVLSHEDFSKHC